MRAIQCMPNEQADICIKECFKLQLVLAETIDISKIRKFILTVTLQKFILKKELLTHRNTEKLSTKYVGHGNFW